ncbi:MAG: hypothetical protein QT08_C0008G0013 [archaeon GW2011_AR17]|nr:MAG: hypothetical protein QT08_C0008G0013 [archaeon GW2011_AR17]MBS3153777.1 hypothetical protein [Candidatus Woesearchaeota archaeon]HIH15197.1 hypothetical protein [Nanoarchaeota archaeon]HIH59463.1 hypothetical protein [Nanoarchaeota archaeon]HII13861.1 hypothetical protein [Nanoarchaeota archaeon]
MTSSRLSLQEFLLKIPSLEILSIENCVKGEDEDITVQMYMGDELVASSHQKDLFEADHPFSSLAYFLGIERDLEERKDAEILFVNALAYRGLAHLYLTRATFDFSFIFSEERKYITKGNLRRSTDDSLRNLARIGILEEITPPGLSHFYTFSRLHLAKYSIELPYHSIQKL